MKTLLFTIVLLALPLQSMGSDFPVVDKGLFQTFQHVYEVGFQQEPCSVDEDVCTIEVREALCLRFGDCSFTFLKNDENVYNEVRIAPSGDSLNLHNAGYMAIRSAYGVKSFHILKTGSPYRPNFKVLSPIICTQVKSTDSITCQ